MLVQIGKSTAQRFDCIENLFARLLAQHVTQQGAKQPHLRAQMFVSQQVQWGIHGLQGLNKAVHFLTKMRVYRVVAKRPGCRGLR